MIVRKITAKGALGGLLLSLSMPFVQAQATISCKKQPPFIHTLAGFTPSKSALSTSENRQMGLQLIEVEDVQKATHQPRTRTYQHPSWTMGGWLGALVIDDVGDTYVIPAPMVNVLHNPQALQNTLYKVEGTTGIMDVFMPLPYPAGADQYNIHNPYGLLGLHFDCDTRSLYAASVLGSTDSSEVGRIYHIDVATKKIISQLEGIDAMGVVAANLTGEKRLFFAKTRSSEIYSVPLAANGAIIADTPRLELSMEGIGVRGDDRGRRLRITPKGHLMVNAISFYYNLTAPTEKQESVFVFRYDKAHQQWLRVE